MTSRRGHTIFFVCGLPRSGTTAAIRGIRTFPNVYAIPYELAVPEILYRLNYSIENKSFQPAFNEWLSRQFDQVVYRYENDPDHQPFDSQLIRAYEQLLARFRDFVKEPCGFETAARTANNFFYQAQQDSACDILVEKTPSTALFQREAMLISPTINLLSCVREPSAFVESCRRRLKSSIDYEKAGFEGGDDAYTKEVVYYFSRIRDSLLTGSSFLLQHECISSTPRSACGYLYSVLFNQAPGLGIINRFNEVVGADTSSCVVNQQHYYSFASALFAELGYPYQQQSDCQPSIDPSNTEILQPFYGMTQTPGKWIKLNERFHAVLIRRSFSCIEFTLLCDCPTSFINEFIFEAQADNILLPVEFQVIDEACKVRVNLSSIKHKKPTLVVFRASSLISSFLSSHCSDELLYNIITDIMYI
jgi:hypothetical protein